MAPERTDLHMSKSSGKPSPHVMISARDLRDIIRDELYGIGADEITWKSTIRHDDIKEIAKTIVKRALLSPR